MKLKKTKEEKEKIMKVELMALAKKESKDVQVNSHGRMFIPGETSDECIPVVRARGTDVYLATAIDGRIATAKQLVEAGFDSIEDVVALAVRTSQDEAAIADVNEMFAGNTGDNGRVLCLTTNGHNRGASVLAMPVLFRNIARKLECGGLYILPSSVDEVLIVLDSWGKDEKIDAAMHMLMFVNRGKVPKDLVLSSNVFYFDAEEGKIRTID